MRLALKPHPETLSEAVRHVEVEWARCGGDFTLLYVVSGDVAGLLVPPLKEPARRDGLWQHTCFEVFARNRGEESYREFNFSPSTEWAAYDFRGYREEMTLADTQPPQIQTRADGRVLELEASIKLPEDPIQLAISAVIEQRDGRKSYWALTHPAAKPDFHHPESFVCEL